MGITEAGRKELAAEEMAKREKAWEQPTNPHGRPHGQGHVEGKTGDTLVSEVEQLVRRGRKAQESVDEIMADANRSLDLKSLEQARVELRELDVSRGMVLKEIAALTSKLGLTESERRNWV